LVFGAFLRWTVPMGLGIRLHLSLSVSHRERIEALLRGGVQEVQTAGRALALRQLDWGFSDSQSWVSGGLGGQDNPGDRTAISGGGTGARAVRCATSGLGAVARSGAASAGGRAGLLVASGAFCTLDSKTYCGKDGSSQDRFGDRSGSYPGASPKPRPEAVAGKNEMRQSLGYAKLGAVDIGCSTTCQPTPGLRQRTGSAKKEAAVATAHNPPRGETRRLAQSGRN
jgi:hypothetical protein